MDLPLSTSILRVSYILDFEDLSTSGDRKRYKIQVKLNFVDFKDKAASIFGCRDWDNLHKKYMKAKAPGYVNILARKKSKSSSPKISPTEGIQLLKKCEKLNSVNTELSYYLLNKAGGMFASYSEYLDCVYGDMNAR